MGHSMSLYKDPLTCLICNEVYEGAELFSCPLDHSQKLALDILYNSWYN